MTDAGDRKEEDTQTLSSDAAVTDTPQSNSTACPVQPLRTDQLCQGSWVKVKPATVINETLDTNGTTDGLPFMPEMLACCGMRFQIARFANKVCANVSGVEIREMQNVVVLKMKRCDGCFHGGCQMGCEFLWKLDWLEHATGLEPDPTSDLQPESTQPKIRERLVQWTAGAGENEQAKSSGRFFRCQATELGAASRQSSPLHFEQYFVEHKSNGTPWSSITRFVMTLLVKKLLRISDHVSGPCKKTPVEALNLQPGDQVKVKSFDKILQTLDARGCNRGLWFDPAEMKSFCGKTLTVTRRIDRIIHEGSGKLLEMKLPSIVLNETQCSGVHRRFCSRAMLHFWREVWLERVNG